MIHANVDNIKSYYLRIELKEKIIFLYITILGPYGAWKNIGECSVTCGKNGTQHSQRHCSKDVALVVPRDKPLFCGETLNKTETCSAESECPSKKNHIIKDQKPIIWQFNQVSVIQ